MWTDENLVEMYKHLVVYVLETAMNKTEHGVCLLDFVCQVFGKLGVVLVNMFVAVVSYVHCLTFCHIKSEFPSFWFWLVRWRLVLVSSANK